MAILISSRLQRKRTYFHERQGVGSLMGWREAGWVADNSPYKHDARLVHLILAENADKARDYELPDNRREVARKAAVSMRTVTAVFATMVEDGYLEIVEAPAGKAIKYRFMIPTLAESARGEVADPSKMARPTLAKSAPTLANDEIELFSNDNYNKNTNGARSPAELMLRAWWEAQDPRPTISYVGARQIIEKLVKAGWSVQQVRSALEQTLVVTRAALELELGRQRRKAPSRNAETIAAGQRWIERGTGGLF
jgi:hypothetical protein